MFAIEISEENMQTILERGVPSVNEDTLGVYLRSHAHWVLITGYLDNWGRLQGFSVLPRYLIEQHYDYNSEVIQTDWDQIVRKEHK